MMWQIFETMSEKSVEAGGWLVAGAASVVLVLSKLRATMSQDKNGAAIADANNGIITLLRAEIDRLSAQNTRLAIMVNDLQMQVIEIRKENHELRDAVCRIQDDGK